jgi:hypothetical protein
MMRWHLDRGCLLLLGFALAALPTLGWASGPIRVVVAVLLTTVVPGYALLRPLALGDAVVVAVGAVALSLATTTLASLALGYLAVWSWPACAGVLSAVTAAAVVAHATGAER